MNWLREKLVDDLSAIWKRWSFKIVAAQVVFVGTWAALSAIDFVPVVPDWVKGSAVLFFSAAAMTVAFVKQPKAQ